MRLRFWLANRVVAVSPAAAANQAAPATTATIGTCFCIGPGDDESCHTVRLRWPKWQEVTVFGGVQGFKGPYDQERDSGNFGFNEGFNIGAKVPYAELGYQFGMRNVHSQLNGDKDTGIDESHFQTFRHGRPVPPVLRRPAIRRRVGRAQRRTLSRASVPSAAQRDQHLELRLHEFGFTGSFGTNDHRAGGRKR